MLDKKLKIISLFAALLVGLVGALIAFSDGPNTVQAAVDSRWYAAAPYYMPLDNAPPDISTVMNATGQKSVMLAFILSDGGCNPAWDGNTPLSNGTISSVISTIRNKGGDVNVSGGGYNGTKLGQVCGTPQATADAYQKVINAYQLKAFDLDIEEPEIENSAAVHNELAAAQILQRNNPGIYLSITIPATNSGANYFGNLLIKDAASLSFVPNSFSLMTFDGVPTASAALGAQDAFHSQLQTVYPGLSSAQIYALQGFSLMNGHTDSAEHFSQADFQTILNYTLSNHLGRYTYWSVNRDRACAGNADILSGSCSGVSQNDWDFTRYTVSFATQGGPPPTPGPTPTAGPTATPTPAGSCSAPAYNASTVYTNGMQVSYNGHKWQAKWWTQGEAPSTGGSGVWQDLGTCGGGNPGPTPTAAPNPTPTPVPNPTATPRPTTPASNSWAAGVSYSVGAVVSYNGHSYRCIQAHTSQVGWEPPNVPALWQAL